MDYQKKLKEYKQKTITKAQMEELFDERNEESLFSVIKDLEEKGILEHVKNSHTNGNLCYPIYLKYRVHLADETYDTELKEIRNLHPILQNSNVLQKNPAEYRKYRSDIQKLDRYLFTSSESKIPISRKERSFQIFSQEKQLDDTAFCNLLKKIGLGKQELRFYDTPEYCFNDFIPVRNSVMTLLICENKDIWFNIRRRMFEDHVKSIFGIRIDGVVYGCGNQISQYSALTEYTQFMGESKVRYFYWGDIDRAGLNIYLSLVKNNPELKIEIFSPAYEEMIRLSKRQEIPDSEDKREIIGDYSLVYQQICSDLREDMVESIAENKRIPQEIITYESLLSIMR